MTVTATLSAAKTTQFTVTVTAAAVSPATDASLHAEREHHPDLRRQRHREHRDGDHHAGRQHRERVENKEITVSGAVAAGVTGVTGPADVTLTITDNDHPVINHTLTLHREGCEPRPCWTRP